MFRFTTSNLDLSNTSANPVLRVMSIVITAGATATTVTFRNGSVTGAILLEVKVPANDTKVVAPARPMTFGSGVFVVPDANTSSGTIQAG